MSLNMLNDFEWGNFITTFRLSKNEWLGSLDIERHDKFLLKDKF